MICARQPFQGKNSLRRECCILLQAKQGCSCSCSRPALSPQVRAAAAFASALGWIVVGTEIINLSAETKNQSGNKVLLALSEISQMSFRSFAQVHLVSRSWSVCSC
jgi:hypothetical protein